MYKITTRGHEVTVVDLLKYDKGSESLYFYKNFTRILDDIRKPKLIKKLLRINEF